MSSKKGQILVEVMVAMSILTIVTVSIFRLIIGVFDVSFAARSTTEVSALAQKGLSKGLTTLKSGCVLNFEVNRTIYPPDNSKSIGNDVQIDQVSVPGKNLVVTVVDLSVDEMNSPLGVNNTNFAKVVSTVTWNDKGVGARTYSVSQIVRKSGN